MPLDLARCTASTPTRTARKDPYNPVDAIFAAARYLKAAGYEKDVRARDLRLQPRRLVRRLGDAARAPDRRRAGRPRRLADRPDRGPLPRLRPRALRRRPRREASRSSASSAARTPPTSIESERRPPRASTSSPARARRSSRSTTASIKKIGDVQELGRYVVLQDVYGNRYTYAHLGSVVEVLPGAEGATPTDPEALRASARQGQRRGRRRAEAAAPASAGRQPDDPARARAASRRRPRARAPTHARRSVPIKERLFAHPDLPGAREAGGLEQLLDAQGAQGRRLRDLQATTSRAPSASTPRTSACAAARRARA